MVLFNGLISISNIYTLLFVVFAVLMAGYALGRITVKGISLGDAGVFIVALLCGALFFEMNDAGLMFAASSKPYNFETGLSIIESLGLEEDAARRVETKDGFTEFRLDRLGIPLAGRWEKCLGYR